MTTKRQQKPRASASREPDYIQTVDANIAKKIKEIREGMGLNMGPFAEKLKVSKASVSLWERGEVPSPDALLKFAKLASQDEALRLYFLRQAGVDTEWLESAVAREYLRRREHRLDDPTNITAEIDWLPIRASARAAGKEIIGHIPVVKTRITNPEATFCVEVGADSARGPYPVGSLVIIDGSRRGILGPDEVLDATAKASELAVFYEDLPQWEGVVSPPDLLSHEDLRKVLEFYKQDPDKRAQQGSGVRFGTTHLQVRPSREGRFWSYTLGGDRSAVLLTKWTDGRLPQTDKAAHLMIGKGIHILGTVIGWLAPIRPAYPEKRER